jgi:ubiquinone/menaquinone biosynthesis C-methylase UbiE
MVEEGKDADIWARWLLQKRHANDPAFESFVRAEVAAYVERVLNFAQLRPGMTLLDVGTGDGAVAFRAIERIGPTLKVVLSDLSAEMLDTARSEAQRRGVSAQCTFVGGAAESLPEVGDATVDVVTTRAVLAYVADKPAALNEFHRVLKPGGRISLAEPIFQYDAIEAASLRLMLERGDAGGNTELLGLIHRWKASQYPDTMAAISERPMTSFSERTLWEFVRRRGFIDLHMELHMDLRPSPAIPWDVFVQLAPHPLAPTLAEILNDKFSCEERTKLEAHLRPALESGNALTTTHIAYLTAGKAVVTAAGTGRPARN